MDRSLQRWRCWQHHSCRRKRLFRTPRGGQYHVPVTKIGRSWSIRSTPLPHWFPPPSQHCCFDCGGGTTITMGMSLEICTPSVLTHNDDQCVTQHGYTKHKDMISQLRVQNWFTRNESASEKHQIDLHRVTLWPMILSVTAYGQYFL